MNRKVGDIITLEATGDFYPGIECMVTQVDRNGRVIKMKSLLRDERLAKMGFILEGDDYVAVEWDYSPN